MKYPSIVVLGIALLAGTASAAVWYVHPDSTMNCIQDCLDSCTTGDTVLVGPGTYLENITWPSTQQINLVSEYGPDTTLIDGDSSDMVIHVAGLIDTMTVISGFTITNGYNTDVGGIHCDNASPKIEGNTICNNFGMWGGGIACWNSDAAPLIINNIIRNNIADSTGGGIVSYNYATPMILNNVIDSNTANWGGAIYCHTWSSPIIEGNEILSNTGGASAGGIYCFDNSSPTIADNIISENQANYGGGIACWSDCSPIIKHNIITLNSGVNYGAGIRANTSSSPQIDSCIIANNEYDGVFCSVGSNPIIHHCNIYGHTNYGVWNNDPNVTIDAENVWWGHATGPWPVGQGNGVSDYVDYDPWLTDSVQGIGIEELVVEKPLAFSLQVSPNPFTYKTDIRYQMTDNGTKNTEGEPILRIYDACGRLVKSFRITPNVLRNTLSWDGRDDQNRMLGSGVYFVKLSSDNHSETRKVLLVR